MLQQTTVEYGGKLYKVELDHGQTMAGDDPSLPVGPRWVVTIGATAVTTFPAGPHDTEESVRAETSRILDRLPDLTDRDQIHLGGG